MALTPPDATALGLFRQEAFADSEIESVNFTLQQATDALWIFSGLDQLPDDPRAARVVNYAIMDLTLWLITQREHLEEINSPFSSERIGSYSYSKMSQAQQGTSGIYWLDLLFRMLGNPEDPLGGGASWVSTQWVFDTEQTPDHPRQFEEDPNAFYRAVDRALNL